MSISLLALIIMVWCEVRLSFKYEFWLESIILFLFGISWLVKGGAILRDQ
jgi:hypothetical protein